MNRGPRTCSHFLSMPGYYCDPAIGISTVFDCLCGKGFDMRLWKESALGLVSSVFTCSSPVFFHGFWGGGSWDGDCSGL